VKKAKTLTWSWGWRVFVWWGFAAMIGGWVGCGEDAPSLRN